ncbi:hypothetical protein CO610_04270 [Lysobacteraceae bacterium NML95-0200]|nr:hypothetical protein CO610_04270 [Xanthomonadaceae bacterium NML95-0200]
MSLVMTGEQVEDIVQLHLTLCQSMHSTQRREKPLLLLVAGQPGAGKTGLAETNKQYLRAHGGYIHLDADRLRELLPGYAALAAAHGEAASEITQAAAGACVTRLRQYAVETRRNILEEGTLRAGADTFTRYIQRMQEVGYLVELRVLAVSPEESLLGIYKRYEGQIAAHSPAPRFVPEDYHRSTTHALAQTIAALEKQADKVLVFDRRGHVLHQHLRGDGDSGASAILCAAQQDNNAQSKAALALGWDAIFKTAHARNAKPDYLQRIALHQARLHAAMRADMEASKIYDDKLPGAQAFSQKLAAHSSH